MNSGPPNGMLILHRLKADGGVIAEADDGDTVGKPTLLLSYRFEGRPQMVQFTFMSKSALVAFLGGVEEMTEAFMADEADLHKVDLGEPNEND